MGGTIGGLPYPTGTDRVVDGDNAIQALATAVDKNPRSVVANVGDFTPGTGWAALGSGIRYIAINGWVWLYGRASRASGTSTSIGTIPTAYGPPETFRIQGSNGIVVAISGGGNITVDTGNPAAGTNVSFATSYPFKGA